MKPPAFQFYADDFLGGTITMSHAERGLYIQALCLQWTQGAIERDDLEALAGSVPVAKVAAKFAVGDDGKLRNARLESERQKQADYRQIQANKGKASAKARLNRGLTAVQPGTQPEVNRKATGHPTERQPEVNSPSPSPSPSPVSVTNSVTVTSKGGVPLEPSAPSADPAPVKRFSKPTPEEVGLQCAKIGLPDAEVAKFLSYYESNGWRVGRNPMRSWPHALQNWKINHDSNHARNGRPSPLSPSAARNANIAGHDEWKRDADAADAAAALAGNQEAPW